MRLSGGARPSPAALLVPVALTAHACAVYLALDVRPVDLVNSDFRADLVADHGLLLWNGDWYGGHYLLTYSVLAPPLTALLGSVAVAIASALASAALFADIAHRHFGRSAWLGATWFGLAAATNVFHGRIAFALGVALGLGAVAALQRRRALAAAVLALAAGLASPVAGLFLALAAAALAFADRRRDAAATALAAIAPALALALAFPEGGRQIYRASELIELLAASAAVAIAAGRRERVLATGAALYAATGAAAYAVHTPLGNNVVRMAALFGGPLVACALANRRLPKPALAVAALVLAAFAYGQWHPAINDVRKVANDPAAEPSYYAPLNAFLDRRRGAYRVEIPFTRAHGEAAEVAPRHPLARGWQRQLDIERNPIFYGGRLNASTYARWLAGNGVRFVALPDAVLDSSSTREGELIESGLPYLRPVAQPAHWRVYELTRPHALASGRGAGSFDVTSLDVDGATLYASAPGEAVVKLRWSQYWRLDGGCVERAGDWTRVTARRTGRLRLEVVFAPGRLLAHGRRCG
jgi:hypothetical protein